MGNTHPGEKAYALALKGNAIGLAALVEKHPEAVDWREKKSKRTPLMAAVLKTPEQSASLELAQAACVDVLLRHGADVALVDRKKRTALHTACRNRGATGTVRHLLRAGTAVDARDAVGETALHYAWKTHSLGAQKALYDDRAVFSDLLQVATRPRVRHVVAQLKSTGLFHVLGDLADGYLLKGAWTSRWVVLVESTIALHARAGDAPETVYNVQGRDNDDSTGVLTNLPDYTLAFEDSTLQLRARDEEQHARLLAALEAFGMRIQMAGSPSLSSSSSSTAVRPPLAVVVAVPEDAAAAPDAVPLTTVIEAPPPPTAPPMYLDSTYQLDSDIQRAIAESLAAGPPLNSAHTSGPPLNSAHTSARPSAPPIC